MLTTLTHTTSHPAERVRELFDLAGVTIGGRAPGDIEVHDDRFYSRLLAEGSLGLGESYMDGWWECRRIDVLIDKILRADLTQYIRPWRDTFDTLRARLLNLQTVSRSEVVGKQHYDLSVELYRRMLDKRMIYSCAYWRDAADLDSAQEAKLDLIAHKLELEPGMRVLDIGCGWGGTAGYLAETYGVEMTGVTISREQAAYGRVTYGHLPVHIRLQDYREVDETFDRVISIGMFEHVGQKNYDSFMKTAHRCLKPGGLMLLHTIGCDQTNASFDPWLNRHIFPNAHIPSVRQVAESAEGRFAMEDWHNFGPDYDRTLLAWHDRFESAWPHLADSYDERFRRMWRYYLLMCAGTFRARQNQVWQIVFSSPTRDRYRSVR